MAPLVIQVQVIQAQPFGDTEIVVYNAEFLPAPRGPEPPVPSEPPPPEWVAVALVPAHSDTTPPPATLEPST